MGMKVTLGPSRDPDQGTFIFLARFKAKSSKTGNIGALKMLEQLPWAIN